MMRLRNFEKLVTRRFLTALGFVSLGAIAAAKADCVSQRLTFANIQRSFVLCLPPGSKPGLPVLLLLHGSGGRGAEMAALWEGFAAREGIILLAPDALHNDAWHLKDDSPDFLHALINGVQTRTAADRRRLYLFGQSGGAVYALTLAMLESQYFAAVAIHAGGWRSPAEFKVMSLARRRIPLKIIVGARDEYFSTASVRRTQDALKTAGFPMELEIVPGQHHGFTGEIAAATEDSAWRFLASVTLTEKPIFIEYPQLRA
jgi:poly(3-hydroxybutyrate) depolymerase